MEWKSNAKYGQREDEGSIFSLKPDGVMTVHHYVGCGNKWFLTCKMLDIEMVDLKTTDFIQAEINAKTVVEHKIEQINSIFAPIIADKSRTTFSRY